MTKMVDDEPPMNPPPSRPAAPPPRPGPPPPRPGPPPSRPAPPAQKPDRPAPPPSRPPPAKPGPPPARPAPPPSRPAPPVAAVAPPPPTTLPVTSTSQPSGQPTADKPDKPEETSPTAESDNEKAGFSSIFGASIEPITESDIPISDSCGSLVSAGQDSGQPSAATPSSKPMSSSSSSSSLAYPDGYDPVNESHKSWINGTEQVVPPVLPASR